MVVVSGPLTWTMHILVIAQTPEWKVPLSAHDHTCPVARVWAGDVARPARWCNGRPTPHRQNFSRLTGENESDPRLRWAGLGWLGWARANQFLVAVSCSLVPSDRRHQADSFTKYLWKNICCCILSHCCIQYVAGWDQDMMVLGRGLPPHPGTAGGSVWIQHLLLQVLPPYKPQPRLPSLHIPCV